MEMLTNCSTVAAATATFLAVFSSATLYAGPLQFGVVGSPIDLSANVSEAILPGGTIFQDSKPLFGTSPDPKQSAQLLHISSAGVNTSNHSTLTGAFASSLAESNGNGGVGVSQTIFGSPGGTDPNSIRQLVAQSLWTQTFLYSGTPTVDLKLHIVIPPAQVELNGIPPNRDFNSDTETAQVLARLDTVITHPGGTFSKGGSFEFGMKEFELQLSNPTGGFLNFADVDLFGAAGTIFAPVTEDFAFDGSRVRFRLDPFATDVDLGVLNQGDTLSYVYTITAEGTTHGFEQAYDAFIGDPFGVDVVTGNLGVTVSLASANVSEPSTLTLIMLSLIALLVGGKGLPTLCANHLPRSTGVKCSPAEAAAAPAGQPLTRLSPSM